MTKDDWLKLAMPASISLLALAMLTAPVLVKAQLTAFDTIAVMQSGTWRMQCD